MQETLVKFSSDEGKDKAENYLDWFKPHFDAALEGFLIAKEKEASAINSEAAVLVEEIRRFAFAGGKRVRPAFLYAGYIAAGGMSHDPAIFASLSVELLHTFALIHDDIIDNSPLRRGHPTTHRVFEKQHLSKGLKGEASKYGLSTAILAGDLAIFFADQILTEAPFPQERLRRALTYFDQMKIQVLYGEYLDVLSGYQEEITQDQALQILDYKTARYTVERPLHIGSTLAGADPNTIEVLTAYAIPLGQAFQLQDDIVGIFGDEKEIGKPTDSDIKEGKKTLLIAKAFEEATSGQKAVLKKVLGKQEASSKEIDQVKQILVETGAYDYSVSLAKKLIEQALEAIKDADLASEGKDYLIVAAEHLLNREV